MLISQKSVWLYARPAAEFPDCPLIDTGVSHVYAVVSYSRENKHDKAIKGFSV